MAAKLDRDDLERLIHRTAEVAYQAHDRVNDKALSTRIRTHLRRELREICPQWGRKAIACRITMLGGATGAVEVQVHCITPDNVQVTTEVTLRSAF